MMQATQLYTILLASFFFSATASAQVFDPGPSDPALFTNVINLPGDVSPTTTGGVDGETTQVNVANSGGLPSFFFARTGSEVNISGGNVSNFFALFDGSEVNISGGSVGDNFEARTGSQVTISGGSVGDDFKAHSMVDISGGTVGMRFDAHGLANISGGSVGAFSGAFNGSVVSINGGSVGNFFSAQSGSVVNISDGSVGNFFDTSGTAEVTISGGSVGHSFNPSGDVELVGGEFKLNGEAFTDSIITLGGNDIFTGTLADGSVFIFSELAGDNFVGASMGLSFETPPPASQIPIVVATPINDGPRGLRDGQSLNLQTGGDLGGSFAVVNATLNIEGGHASLEVIGSEINISGGDVGLQVFDGSEINISGGSFGHTLGPFDSFQAFDGFQIFDGGTVNLLGSDFAINGVPLDGLIPGEASTVLDRNVTLSGILADGSAFSFDLSSNNPHQSCCDSFFQDYFASGATLTITSEPLLGDINRDGDVNFLDITPFISVLSTGDFLGQADINEDGSVNFLDISPFITLLSS